MPLIKCECGAEFLLLPDVKEMGRLIDSHSLSHIDNEKNLDLAEAKVRQIQDSLTKQALEKAIENSLQN
jgi:hypothetical protein